MSKFEIRGKIVEAGSRREALVDYTIGAASEIGKQYATTGYSVSFVSTVYETGDLGPEKVDHADFFVKEKNFGKFFAKLRSGLPYPVSGDLSDWFVDGGRGVLGTYVLVDEDRKLPSAADIEAWKRGEKVLYNLGIDVYVTVYIPTHPITEKEAEEVGIKNHWAGK